MKVSVLSPAKINLCLRVFDRRPDGYHRIESVMVKLQLADRVTVTVEPGDTVSAHVPGFQIGDNLAVRAATEFLRKKGIKRNVSIHIEKQIPIGGGLGGGSSNAAATLLALQELEGGLEIESLQSIAIKLGADVAFFLSSANWALARGIGEEITPWEGYPPISVVLVNPGFPISTASVYQALSRPLTYPGSDDNSFAPRAAPKNWSDLRKLVELGNDLQSVAERDYPGVMSLRKALIHEGADIAQMSGSGATLFGLFQDPTKAEQVAQRLGTRWWVGLTKTA